MIYIVTVGVLASVGLLLVLLNKLKNIMAQADEVVADLQAALDQLTKLVKDVGGFQALVDTHKAKIVELEAIIAAGGTITPALVAKAKEVRATVTALDDGIPELEPPAEPAPSLRR